MRPFKSHLLKTSIACSITLAAVATVFMSQSIFLEISRSFTMEVSQARFTFSITSLFYAATFFFIAPVVDTVDLPRLAVTGLVMLAMAVLCASIAPAFKPFLSAMAVTGVSAALIPAAMFPFVALTAPVEKRGACVGAIVASGTLGVVFGRVIVGVMTAHMGWKHSFRLVSLALFALAAISMVFLSNKKTEKNRTNGTIINRYMNSVNLIVKPETLSLFVSGFLLFFGFLGMVTFLTYRLISPPFNYTSGQVGWISLAGVTALIAPFAGNLSQKTSVFKIILPGMMLCLLSLQLMGWSRSITIITLGMLLLFFGVYCCQPLLFILIGQSVPKESLGSASSLYILFCIGGGSVSSMILGPVWKAYGWIGITLASSISLSMAMVIMLILAFKNNSQSDSYEIRTR